MNITIAMLIVLILIAALAPVFWLFATIYMKDSAQPEPPKWLLKAFFYGALAALLSLAYGLIVESLFGVDVTNEQYSSLVEAVGDAFLLAAIPEELAKFIMLWLLLRKNPFFDEHFDGIVYSVCVGLGFAGLENVLYLINGMEDGSWISIGIARAMFSVPGHYFFAVIMGYFYSIYYFGVDRSIKTKVMVLLAPILAHGLFDSLLFSMQVNESLSLILMILFFVFFSKLKKRAHARIDELVAKSGEVQDDSNQWVE